MAGEDSSAPFQRIQEERTKDVFSLRYPCDRFDVQRMQRKHDGHEDRRRQSSWAFLARVRKR
jgi:hypothetical protein